MTHGMTIKERDHAFDVRGLKMCSPELHKEYNKLKRENAMMKRTIRELWVEHCTPNVCLRGSEWTEIRAAMPDLFRAKRRRSK